MKRFIGLTMAIVLATSNLVFAESVIETKTTVEVTNKPIMVDRDTLEEMKPARKVAESLGYEVTWDSGNIYFTFNNQTFASKVGSTQYLYNGEVVLEASKTKLEDGKAYIPSSFVTLLEKNVENAFNDDFYIERADIFLKGLVAEDYYLVEKRLNGLLEIDQMKEIWNQISSGIGEFKEIEVDKYEVTSKEDEQIGTYIAIQQYAKFSKMGVITTYYFAENGNLIGIFFNFYDIEENQDVLPEGIEEIAYTVGVNKTQNASLMKNEGKTSDTVVLLVAGSGPNDLDENIYGNKPFKDIAIGLAENGIDSFRFDKVTYAIQNGKYVPEDIKTFTVQDEYLVDVKEVTQLLKDMGYEHIYLLGHSQGAMLAPRLYEDNDGVYDGLILMAGTPRTFTDIANDQATNQINSLDEEQKKAYDGYVEAETEKIEKLDTYTDEELFETAIYNLPAYYLKEMNSYDAGEIAKRIDKPFLVLQGTDDFQVFADIDYELWKEVLKDNSEAKFVLYDGLGHLFTKIPENATNSVTDYIPPQKMDSKVIEDIVNFINK